MNLGLTVLLPRPGAHTSNRLDAIRPIWIGGNPKATILHIPAEKGALLFA